MLVKCGMVVLAIGATACGLLTLRQSRLQAASELAQAQLRIGTSDERLWALRSQIAERVTPSNVERMAASVGPLKPIIAPPLAIPAPGDALPKLAYESDVPGAPRKLQVVSNTASGQRDLAQAAETLGPVAKVTPAPAKPSAGKTGTTSDTNAELKADTKTSTKANGKPVAKPAPTGKKVAPTKPPPVDTLIRADAGGTPVKVALAPTSKKPAATAKATEKPGAKSAVKAAAKPASSGKPTTVAATSKKQKSAEPKATQIAMQPERR